MTCKYDGVGAFQQGTSANTTLSFYGDGIGRGGAVPPFRRVGKGLLLHLPSVEFIRRF
jgi:hypothetical protein